ncbi:chemokine-like protein TAFA-5a isoform X2 [Phyllopteryx taeniolatus]|uniref:chemokine-like protein TAFA-5a isoform X2 n=1 Tax=Phyllopteryx taeniolatus TaxID=161469 RepID=UPI002AD41CEB|nr:chemokine-like protein TAFA-5a isoform X2 [Phyllopteryx taeniolatus]
MQLLRVAWALTGAAICCFLILLIHSRLLKEGQLAAGTCEIVTLDRDSSQPRRTIARQTARCACKKGQIAGTTRARPACVDGSMTRQDSPPTPRRYGEHRRPPRQAPGHDPPPPNRRYHEPALFPGSTPPCAAVLAERERSPNTMTAPERECLWDTSPPPPPNLSRTSGKPLAVKYCSLPATPQDL